MVCRLLLALIAGAAPSSVAVGQNLPNGQPSTALAAPSPTFKTPVARTGPDPTYIADGGATIARSPDGR